MTVRRAARLGFLGAGNIAGPYGECVRRHHQLALVGVFDVDEVKRAQFAAAFECRAYESFDEMCADELDLVVNLTGAPHHYATTKALLQRGLTVYSEKPLALEARQARALIELVADRPARLACSPSLWLGRATMAAADAVHRGLIGEVRLVSAEVNQGRIETWHPSPQVFYQVGPVVDVGVYPLAFVTAVLGPIRSVVAECAVLLGERRTIAGEDFSAPTADGWVVLARTAGGCLVRISCNFYVASATSPRSLEFHGDSGSIRVDDWLRPGSAVHHAAYGSAYDVMLTADPASDLDWTVGVVDLVEAAADGRSPRAGAEHAAHIVEVLQAVDESARRGRRVLVQSEFPSPFTRSDR